MNEPPDYPKIFKPFDRHKCNPENLEPFGELFNLMKTYGVKEQYIYLIPKNDTLFVRNNLTSFVGFMDSLKKNNGINQMGDAMSDRGEEFNHRLLKACLELAQERYDLKKWTCNVLVLRLEDPHNESKICHKDYLHDGCGAFTICYDKPDYVEYRVYHSTIGSVSVEKGYAYGIPGVIDWMGGGHSFKHKHKDDNKQLTENDIISKIMIGGFVNIDIENILTNSKQLKLLGLDSNGEFLDENNIYIGKTYEEKGVQGKHEYISKVNKSNAKMQSRKRKDKRKTQLSNLKQWKDNKRKLVDYLDNPPKKKRKRRSKSKKVKL